MTQQSDDIHLLICSSDVLAYEWRMLRYCFGRLSAPDAPPSGTQEHDAIFEAGLVHSRALIEFFFGCKRRPSDIHVSLWFAPDSQEYLGFAASQHRCACWTEKSEIDKRLAHLTTARIGNTVFGHDLRVPRWLDDLMLEFVALAGNRVSEGLKHVVESSETSTVRIYPSTSHGTRGDPDMPRDQRAPG